MLSLPEDDTGKQANKKHFLNKNKSANEMSKDQRKSSCMFFPCSLSSEENLQKVL